MPYPITHTFTDAGLAVGPLYRLRRKWWKTAKFTRPQSTWLLCVGCNAAGISQTRTHREILRTLIDYAVVCLWLIGTVRAKHAWVGPASRRSSINNKLFPDYYQRACVEINFSGRQDGLTLSYVIYDRRSLWSCGVLAPFRYVYTCLLCARPSRPHCGICGSCPKSSVRLSAP